MTPCIFTCKLVRYFCKDIWVLLCHSSKDEYGSDGWMCVCGGELFWNMKWSLEAFWCSVTKQEDFDAKTPCIFMPLKWIAANRRKPDGWKESETQEKVIADFMYHVYVYLGSLMKQALWPQKCIDFKRGKNDRKAREWVLYFQNLYTGTVHGHRMD